MADTELSANPREDIPEEFQNRQLTWSPPQDAYFFSSHSLCFLFILNFVMLISVDTGMPLLRRYQDSLTLTSKFP